MKTIEELAEKLIQRAERADSGSDSPRIRGYLQGFKDGVKGFEKESRKKHIKEIASCENEIETFWTEVTCGSSIIDMAQEDFDPEDLDDTEREKRIIIARCPVCQSKIQEHSPSISEEEIKEQGK